MKFYSEELQKSFESVQPILESISETKTHISTDIKEFEKYLKSLGINESLEYTILIPSENVNLDNFSNEYGAGSGIAKEGIIKWDNDKKRLMYIEKEYESFVDIYSNDPVNIDKSTVVTKIERPLIETSFETRKLVYEKHLKNFILYLSDRYAIKENSSNSEDEEIPF